MFLVFLLLMIVITSQFEWKQQLVVDVDSSSSISQKQQRISKGVETIKEKVLSFSYFLFCLLYSSKFPCLFDLSSTDTL
jgi:hypothetical protein